MVEFLKPHTVPSRRAEDKYKFSAMIIIPVALLGLLSFTLVALIFFDARPNNHDILLMVITFITAKLGTIVDHHFGSSASAGRKDEIIATQSNTMEAAQKTLSAVTASPGEVKLQPGDEVKVEAVEEKK